MQHLQAGLAQFPVARAIIFLLLLVVVATIDTWLLCCFRVDGQGVHARRISVVMSIACLIP